MPDTQRAAARPPMPPPFVATTGKPLIISGPPRSGTTMFSALLDGHSQINWFLDEGFFFEHLDTRDAMQLECFLAAARLGRDSLIEGIRDRSLMPPTHKPPIDFPELTYAWSEEKFRSALDPQRIVDLGRLWDTLVAAYFAGFGYASKPYVSMKAADYGRSVFGALQHCTNSRGIVVVREPVASVNSLKRYRQRRQEKHLTWPTLSAAVAEMNRLAERVGTADAGRLRWYRYEDVIKDTPAVMRDVVGWLGLPFESGLLQPSMLGVPWSGNSSFEGVDGGPASAARPSVLTREEADFVARMTAPFQATFGYAA